MRFEAICRGLMPEIVSFEKSIVYFFNKKRLLLAAFFIY
jgi:hypothetical protein